MELAHFRRRFHLCGGESPTAVYTRIAHRLAAMSIDTNPTRKRGYFFSRNPRLRERGYAQTHSLAPRARKRKKPWRYRWPDDFRDEVLARLLELNKQRAEQERLTGLAAAEI
jgi:hypothetical protein